MVIKAVVFDIGQTLANQPNKEGLQARNKVYYRYIHDTLVSRNYASHFSSFATYDKEQFVEDLNTSVVARKKLKDERVDMLIEYTLSQHVLEVILAHAGTPDRAADFAHLLPELNEITADTSHISKAMYELWPDTLSVLQELKDSGYKIAVASNGAHAAKHELLLETLGVRQYVDELIISSYVGVRKPNPEMLLHIARVFGLTKDELVVVGDMLDRDVLMGNTAGVRSIWINTLSYNPAQNLKRIHENNPLFRPTAGIVALSQLLPTIKYLDQGAAADQLQVGYYFPGIKKKLDMGMQHALVPTRRVNFFPVELLAPLEFQGRIDILLHKATDLHLSKDPAMKQALQDIENYHHKHKEVLILDSVQALYTTTRRDKFEYILDFNEEDAAVRIPVTYAKEGVTRFPVIIKSAIACQIRNSHKIVTVRSEAGLAGALAEFGEDEVVVQEMVRHSGLMYKVFVLGNDHVATRRESLAEPQADFEVYDSSKLSENPADEGMPWELNEEIIERVNRRVQAASSMTMFGYDIVVEAGTGAHVIVDLNYFPSYHGFPDFPRRLEEHVIRMAARHKSSLLPQVDPGF